MQETTWEHVGSMPELPPGQVLVFQFGLDQESGFESDCLNALERARAERFKRAEHAQRFVAGRSVLRNLLAYYTDLPPQTLDFTYGEHGKPFLSPPPGSRRTLHFNLSHSRDRAVCALTWNSAVGIDIEYKKARASLHAIAKRYFSEQEAAFLANCDEGERLSAFYQYWTAKEALLKGVGKGLTLPLNRCRFTLQGNPLPLVLDDLPALEADHWAVHPFDVAPGYAAALACSGGDGRNIRYLHGVGSSIP